MPRRRLAYIGFFLAAFGISLAAAMPAFYAVRLLGLGGGPFVLFGVGGTVWSGHASRAFFLGRELGAARWRFHPAALLGGCLGWKAGIDGAIGRATLQIRQCPGDTLRLSEVEAEADAARLLHAVGSVPVSATGRLQARLDRITFAGGWPRRIRGTVLWRDAVLDGAVKANFGTVTVRMRTENHEIVATLSDHGGSSSVEGVLHLARDGRYRIQATLDEALAERLHLKELLGGADVRKQDGVYDLRLSGILHPRAPAP